MAARKPFDAVTFVRDNPALQQLAERWKAEIHAVNDEERKEFSSWWKEHRRWTTYDGSGTGGDAGGNGSSDCGGGD